MSRLQRAIPRLIGRSCRILLITQDYFIVPELVRAMERLRVPFCTIPFRQSPDFLKMLFERLAVFQPDFILTVNHAGLDGEGRLIELLRKCRTPLASWFVDRHELFIRRRPSPDDLLAVFTWDPSSVESLKRKGIPRTSYLPLGTDPEVFAPGRGRQDMSMVAFVGSSWTRKIADNLRAGRYSRRLLCCWRALGFAQAENGDELDTDVMARHCPGLKAELAGLDEASAGLYTHLIQLEASRIRRLQRLRDLLKFAPLIVGDTYWKRALSKERLNFTWMPRLHYENELPILYRSSQAIINIPSLQSNASVNQRVFDVPACGGFVLSESSPALNELFEPWMEIISYQGKEEMLFRIAWILEDKQGRNRIALAARKRILAQHTYEHRLIEIIRRMREVF